jgi:two-component system CheB/CheR fusion protein
MVMVGPDLGVRRFTPQAAKVLGLTATDVGRPITRLKLKAELDNLEQMMLDVIAEVRPKQYRVHDSDGHGCELRLTPYRTADNRIGGVVLSVLTADELENYGSPRPESAAPPAAKRRANMSKTGKRK